MEGKINVVNVVTNKQKVIEIVMNHSSFSKINSGDLTIGEIENMKLSKEIIEQTINSVFIPKIFKQLKRINFKKDYENIAGLYIRNLEDYMFLDIKIENKVGSTDLMVYSRKNDRLSFNNNVIDYLTINIDALKHLEKLFYELKKLIRNTEE